MPSRADGSEDEVVIWTKYFLMRKKQKNEANDVTPRKRKRLRRIREKYEAISKPWRDQEVITKIAELRLLTQISGFNHFDHYFGDC
jgi:phosphomevalonate kinase